MTTINNNLLFNNRFSTDSSLTDNDVTTIRTSFFFFSFYVFFPDKLLKLSYSSVIN